ncbi:hypothetical protein [Sphingomonas sp. Leaf257]|jgi:hypothetical protein|uniref:hypothetical protein n=1 Tax=Sphingomonas sp. Leaf257 TaxID=1736309 RepID=UPI000A5D45C7
MTKRPLTPAEETLARSVFGDAIDYTQVRLSPSKWAFFQPRDTVMAPTGCIHFHPKGDLWREDFGACPLHEQGLFIHEMVMCLPKCTNGCSRAFYARRNHIHPLLNRPSGTRGQPTQAA